jgi:hypothetical protein
MEEFDILKKLPRVSAPTGFEARVMTALAERKAARTSGAPLRGRLWLAAAPAVLLAAAVLVNIFLLRGPGIETGQAGAGPSEAYSAEGGRNADSIRLIEPLDYRQDILRASEDPGAVYILENVSDEVHRDILY